MKNYKNFLKNAFFSLSILMPFVHASAHDVDKTQEQLKTEWTNFRSLFSLGHSPSEEELGLGVKWKCEWIGFKWEGLTMTPDLELVNEDPTELFNRTEATGEYIMGDRNTFRFIYTESPRGLVHNFRNGYTVYRISGGLLIGEMSTALPCQEIENIPANFHPDLNALGYTKCSQVNSR